MAEKRRKPSKRHEARRKAIEEARAITLRASERYCAAEAARKQHADGYVLKRSSRGFR
jgi:hypothetical protein